MGFFATGQKSSVNPKVKPSDELLRQLGCRGCTLNKIKSLESPKMQPSGSNNPLIYILGEAPSKEADEDGRQFTGKISEFLRPFISARLRQRIRWNNTIRCYPGDEMPDKHQIECCRNSIEQDIEQSRPVAIFGLGPASLAWSGKPSSITMWSGRRFPVKIGNHSCWYYPFSHPSHLIRIRGKRKTSDDEVAFGFHFNKALKEVEEGTLPDPEIHSDKSARSNITCITGRNGKKDLNYVLEFLEYAGTCDVAGVDYETQGLRPYRTTSAIVSKSVSVADETLAYGFDHPEAGWTEDDRGELIKAWIEFLKSPAIKASHNLSFEMEWSAYLFGLDLCRSVPWQDTQTQAFVLDERVGEHKPGAQALEFLVLQHFGLNIKKLTQGLNKERMKDEPLSIILPYNGIDAKYHRLLFNIQKLIIEQEGLAAVYQEKLEQVPTVVLSQIKGLPIDIETNQQLSREYAQKLSKVEKEIQQLEISKEFKRLTGRVFNPGAPQDVIVVLRDILKTRVGQEDSEGTSYSTKESVLSKVSDPIAKAILDYRGIVKLKSTYIDPMSLGSIDLYAGNLLHTNYGTTFTETGRLQSDSPNLQNFPVRSAEGKKIRRQIKAPVVASFDYGQIDARLIACASRDRNYCRALWDNLDIHLDWAHRLAKLHPDFVGGIDKIKDPVVMKKFRGDKVKNMWVFALFYGAALSTTAGRFNVHESVLEPLYKEFWKEFVDVRAMQDRLINGFNELGYTQLFGGLRRRAPLSRGQIVNTGIQAGTNRVVMNAMNRLSATGDPVLQPNMQIHDDLTYCFESEQQFEDYTPIILDAMLDGSAFDWICVPLSVEIKCGPTWADMEEIGAYNSYERLGWPLREKEFM